MKATLRSRVAAIIKHSPTADRRLVSRPISSCITRPAYSIGRHMDEAPERSVPITEVRRRKRKSRSKGLRKTTGCTTCKRRHLKCDEASPECGPCVKSKQICVYNQQVSRPPPLPSQLPSDGVDRCIPQRSNESLSLTVDLMTSPVHGAERISSPISITNTQPHPSNDSVNSYCPITPPDAASYRWFGLLANDATTAVGDFDASRREVLSTINAPPLVNLPLESHHERYTTLDIITPCSSEVSHPQTASQNPWHGSLPSRLSDNELRFFDNFVRNVSLWIDLHDPQRLFSTVVPHLAMHDSGLMAAILALSSRQLSINPNASERERDRKIGLQYYYDTLHYLQQAMSSDAYNVSLELLATSLIVSMYEMLDDSGNGSGWGRHLKGIFWIQRSQNINGETGGLKSAVWWAWLRQDIWAAFREHRKTFSFWIPTKTYAIMTSYEIAARIVWILAKVVDYCSDEEMAAGRNDLVKRLERADVISNMLNEWKKHLPDEFTPLPRIQEARSTDCFEPLWIHPPAFAVSMQVYHAARILILLHKPSLGGIGEHAELQRLVTTAACTICRIAITLTDPTVSLMSSQCLYIAGLSLQNLNQKEAVVRLLDDCYERIGWPRQSLSDDLREQWAKLNN